LSFGTGAAAERLVVADLLGDCRGCSPAVTLNVKMGTFQKMMLAVACAALGAGCARAQAAGGEACPRPAVGSVVDEPEDLRSVGGVLRVDVAFRNELDSGGHMRYCYVFGDGSESPNLRVHPGDLLMLELKNDLTVAPGKMSMAMGGHGGANDDPCTGGKMTAASTNLHLHGLNIPPVCHQDDVLKTSIQPGDPPFEYKVRIPASQPPGLYWYHPHMHGFTKVQVLGGASGALIVEGVERSNKELSGMPERVLVIRDQDLLNPNAPPNPGAEAPPVVLDSDGDVMNTGTGTGKPAKDLSVNFVPVPYPNYEPAIIRMKPRERQLWRVLNASAITYLNLQILFNGVPQWMAVVGLDGVPLNYNGRGGGGVAWQTHVGLAPGDRAEFVFTAPSEGIAALETLSVDTGSGGENDPVRPLASIVVSGDAPEPRMRLATSPEPMPRPSLPWLGDVPPVRTRKLYFSETLQDPKNPNSPTTFFITVDGQQPAAFDPNSSVPNIVVRQGDVEDWIIENRSLELHAFHIHQLHFLLLERFGVPVNEPFLRDTINVPFWDGKTSKFPSVKLRMDFRDPSIVGLFPYHCHLLEHEDGGMMGLIRVVSQAEAAVENLPEKSSGPIASKRK
jgi:FtsP/CotA-like multicopper oxidase with cupredoxin domain